MAYSNNKNLLDDVAPKDGIDEDMESDDEDEVRRIIKMINCSTITCFFIFYIGVR